MTDAIERTIYGLWIGGALVMLWAFIAWLLSLREAPRSWELPIFMGGLGLILLGWRLGLAHDKLTGGLKA